MLVINVFQELEFRLLPEKLSLKSKSLALKPEGALRLVDIFFPSLVNLPNATRLFATAVQAEIHSRPLEKVSDVYQVNDTISPPDHGSFFPERRSTLSRIDAIAECDRLFDAPAYRQQRNSVPGSEVGWG